MNTQTRVVIVRHATEAKLTSNSGRLAHLALPNSVILSHGDWTTVDSGTDASQVRSSKVDEAELRCAGSLLLYGSTEEPSSAPLAPVQRLVVLDGTYRQARRMYKQIEALRDMPELCLPVPQAPIERLRKPPKPGAMATLEAIAYALELIESPQIAAPLHALYAEFVRRMQAQRGYQPGWRVG